jgi:hypothetical protein
VAFKTNIVFYIGKTLGEFAPTSVEFHTDTLQAANMVIKTMCSGMQARWPVVGAVEDMNNGLKAGVSTPCVNYFADAFETTTLSLACATTYKNDKFPSDGIK